MSYKHFCKLVDEAKELGAEVIGCFGFGEPLLDDDIYKKIRYCHRKGLETHITTNASLLTKTRAQKLIDAGLTHIRFSVHGLLPETYEAVHRRLKFVKTIERILEFLHLNDEMSHPVITHMTCMPFHDETVKEFRDFWEDRVDYLEVWQPHNWGGAKEYRDKSKKWKKCNRPKNGPVQIQADGKVIPCCFLTNGEIVLGDTHKKTIEEILKGPGYELFRQLHDEDTLEGMPCHSCDQRHAETESPLLYSNRAEGINKTSVTKINLEE